MQATITNFDGSRAIPTCIGDVFFGPGETKVFKNPIAIDEIKQYQGFSVTITKEPRKKKTPNFSKFSINELRMIARKKGITGTGRMKKPALVKILKETIQ
jgi:hypothetical protein